jgi:hypothetical protein
MKHCCEPHTLPAQKHDGLALHPLGTSAQNGAGVTHVETEAHPAPIGPDRK